MIVYNCRHRFLPLLNTRLNFNTLLSYIYSLEYADLQVEISFLHGKIQGIYDCLEICHIFRFPAYFGIASQGNHHIIHPTRLILG